jgi:hypothetical protein
MTRRGNVFVLALLFSLILLLHCVCGREQRPLTAAEELRIKADVVRQMKTEARYRAVMALRNVANE